MASSGSIVRTEIVSEKFEWKIENFSHANRLYQSPEFTSQNETWKLFMVPILRHGYMGIAIVNERQTSGSPILLEYSFALKTSGGQESFERSGTEIFDEEKYTTAFRWILRSEFKMHQAEYLLSGFLTVVFTMKKVVFEESARKCHFFRSKYAVVNKDNYAPILHKSLHMSMASDEVKNENVSKFEWMINNFSLTQMPYLSPEYTFHSETWQLKIPKITSENICLSVWRKLLRSPILVEFTFALKTSDQHKSFEKCVIDIFDEWKYASAYRWFSKSEFERRQTAFLWSECVTVIITLKILDFVEPASKSGTVFHPKNKICQDYKQMFLSKENCDVVLKVKGQEFLSHKAILMARSPVFASTFRNDMKEKESGIVDIEDIDPSSFSEFLCFVYCGEIENLNKQNACHLFIVADRYEITDLRVICLDFMKQNISVDMFCATLVLAILHCETDLMNACTDFFIQNAEEIMVNDKWLLFVTENPTRSNELFIKYVKSIKHSDKSLLSPCPKKQKLTLE